MIESKKMVANVRYSPFKGDHISTSQPSCSLCRIISISFNFMSPIVLKSFSPGKWPPSTGLWEMISEPTLPYRLRTFIRRGLTLTFTYFYALSFIFSRQFRNDEIFYQWIHLSNSGDFESRYCSTVVRFKIYFSFLFRRVVERKIKLDQ